MDKEQIDRLLDALKNEELDTLFAIVGIEMTSEELESKSEEEKERIVEVVEETLRTMMAQIEDGDFEYFISKLKSDDERDNAIFLLNYIENKEHIKAILQDTEIVFNTRDTIELINNIDADNPDHSYAKDVIEGRVKIGTEPDNELVYELLKTINDNEYIKRILRQNSDLITKFSAYQIEKLGDNELAVTYVRTVMDHAGDKDERGIIRLIESTGDEKLIRETIAGSLGITLNEFELTRLLLKLGDDELIKECVEGKIQNRSKT